MRTGMIALCLGIGAIAWSPALPPIWLPLSVLVLLIFLAWRFHSPRIHPLFIPGCGLTFGVLWATLYGSLVVRSLLPTELEQQPLWLRGRIVDLIDTRAVFGRPAQRFLLRVEDCRREDASSCGVSLKTVQLTAYQLLSINSGESWRLHVRLKRPHGFANPGGFDFESWQVQQGIGALGSVVRGDAEKTQPAANYSVDRWRALLRDWLRARLQHFEHGDLMLALIVADGGDIRREQWQLFRDTGTIHLFVVSGSHIAFTGGLIWWLLRVWRRLPWSTGSRREHVLCTLPPIGVAIGYGLLAGMGLPIQRALIMFAAMLLTTSWRREIRFADALLLALVLVLLHDPLAARDAGCWFSFAAVAALALAISQARGQRWGWLRAQWLVFVVCVPILMVMGGQLTWLSLPANLVAVPLTTVLTLPLAFMALMSEPIAPMLANHCWQFADWSLHVLLIYLGWLRDGGNGLVWPLLLSPQTLLFASIAVVLLLLPRGVPGRALAPVFLLPVLWPQFPALESGALRLTLIDVGQGLAVLIETRTHRMLYDTGPAFASGSSAADLAVLPLLRQRGVAALDLLMVSHHDSDHAGGVGAVLATLPVRANSVGEDLHLSAQNFCSAGQHWQWDGVDFTVLSPSPSSHARGNNRSCVLLIRSGHKSVLLTGDIEKPVEAELLDSGQLSPVDVLVAPHHGSRSSSGPEFVRATAPRYVLISAGHRNPFGHPHPQVVERYRDAGAAVFNTATAGALTLDLGAAGVVAVTEYRKGHRHFWDASGF